MLTSTKRRRLDLFAFLLMVCLAVWVGGGIAVVAVALPTAFDRGVMPREQAADFGVALFPKLNLMEGMIGAVSVLLAAFLGRVGWGTITRHWTATGILLGMTMLVMVFLLFLTPAIVDRVHALRAAGVSLEDTTRMPAERKSLRTLHTVYAGLDGAKLVGGLVVFWLLASRRRR